MPWKPTNSWEAGVLMRGAGLDHAEEKATMYALGLAKEDQDSPGLWLVEWGGEFGAKIAGVSTSTIERAKAKLRKAGLIVLVRSSVKGSVAVWDVTKLIMVKKRK